MQQGYETHKRAVYTAAASQAIDSRPLGEMAGDLLGKTDFLPLAYNNYVICSTTTLHGEVQSVGVFSKVWKWK